MTFSKPAYRNIIQIMLMGVGGVGLLAMIPTPHTRRPDPVGVDDRTYGAVVLASIVLFAPIVAAAYPLAVLGVAIGAVSVTAALAVRRYVRTRRRTGRTLRLCLPGARVCVEV